MSTDAEIANFVDKFRKIYFRGIPHLLNSDGAYLSFGCSFSGTEALAGYRHPKEKFNGVKFSNFVVEYFDVKYQPFADRLWELRNSVIHGFSPKHFALCHGQPGAHFTDRPPFTKVLNADSFFQDFQVAADRYLSALGSSPLLRALFEEHLLSSKGGGLYVG